MRPEDLQRWLSAEPFTPFRLLTTGGSDYEVRHPDMLLVGEHTAVVALPRGADDPACDYAKPLLLADIYCLDPLPLPARGGARDPG